MPKTRGEGEVWRLSNRHPGKLLNSSVKERSRYLASRAERGSEEENWLSCRMMAYVKQVVLVQHPPQAIGGRNRREPITLGTATDMLIQGELPVLGDLLVQRLKARETSLNEDRPQH